MLEQFKRVDFGEWALLAGALSIILLTAVFVTISIRAFILPKAALDHVASLPLDDPPDSEHSPSPPDPSDGEQPPSPPNPPTTEQS